MICVLPFARPDVRLAIELLEWMKQLGGCPNHDCLLVADAATDYLACQKARSIAETVFKFVRLETNDRPVVGWPTGANSLFFTASKFVHENIKEPFLWLEPDAIPLKPGWLEAIDAEYRSDPQASFMGAVYECTTPGLCGNFMSGIAVYPATSPFNPNAGPQSAWDVTNREQMLKQGKRTELIYHFWGQPNLAPTFVETKTEKTPINAFTLEQIPEKAVIWHRCKDGSLLRVLKRKLFPAASSLLVVIAFCGKDVEATLRNVQWMAELGGVKEFPALLSYDSQTKRTMVQEIQRVAAEAFGTVKSHSYQVSGVHGWPEGANIAFQQAARYIYNTYKLPWLWMESDAVPLKPTWLEELSAAYYRHGKAFFGPVVPDRGHVNGVAIYPADTAIRCPRMMLATNYAFDWVGKDEMIYDCCDAEPLIQHVWGQHQGRPHPHAGEPIRFSTVDDVKRWVHPSSVLFHRAKFGDLVTHLRTIRRTA